MSQSNSPAAAQIWHSRATHLAMKLNFHHWLARMVPRLFLLLVLLALFELFRRETALSGRWSGAFFALGLGVVAGASWLRARGHFCTWKKALVRLETVLGLHNRLSAAQEGVVPWPALATKIDDGYSVNWKPILVPLLAGTLFLLSAHFVPVSRMKLGAATGPITEPPEFAQVQSWINALKAEDLIEPAQLEDMQAALDKLRDRPARDWYTQSNLEAANSLKELTEQSMNSLAQDLDQADQAVEALRDKTESPSDGGGLQPMEDALRKAGENLASGNLPLKKELLGELSGGEALADKPLTAAQLEALHERLKQGKWATCTACKSGAAFGDEMRQAIAGAALGQGAERRKLKPGSGGLGGGKETAPLELQPREATTPQGAFTAVNNDDMSHAALGETLKVSSSAHAVDPSAYRGPQNAGAAQIGGSGGEAVWRSTYDPQEADTLSRFFQ